MAQRGNIDYDQIRAASKQGNGLQLQMFGQAAILNGAITSGATSLTVLSNPGTMPSTPFTAEFADGSGEQVRVTAVASLTWTVTRGYNSTTAAAHNNLAVLYCVPTSGNLPIFDAHGNLVDSGAAPSGGGAGGGVNAQTANYTAVSGDSGKLITFNGSSLTATLPTTPPSSTWWAAIENFNSSALTVSSTANINGAASAVTLQQFDVIIVWTDGTNYFCSTPLVAGTNVTLTPASNGKTIAASGGGGGGVSVGTYASLPSPGTSGRLYLCTDAPYALYDTGSVWDAFYCGPAGKQVTIPPSTGWTWDNQGSGTIDWSRGYGAFFGNTASGSEQVRILYRTAPTPPYAATALFEFDLSDADRAEACNIGSSVGFRDGTGKLVEFDLSYSGSASSEVLYYTSSTSFNSAPVSNGENSYSFLYSRPLWIKWQDNNTDLICSYSIDGNNFYQFSGANVVRTAWLSSGPTQIFFGARCKTGNVRVKLLSFVAA